MRFLFSHKKGFTLIELIVTVSVFVMLSLSVLGNYRSTTKSLSLNSLANLISSDIRRAQTYGISSLSTEDNNAYGVSFNMTYPNAYMLFSDNNGNFRNNDNDRATCSGDCVERMTIKSGSIISKLCVDMKKDHLTSTTCTGVANLHIAFQRPDPEPKKITVFGETVIPSDAEIVVTSSDGLLTKTIVVWSTGLITVE